MRVLFQLLGAAAAVAVAGVSAVVLAKKAGKKSPVQVTVDLAEDAETDKETAAKTAAAYEAGVAAGKAHAEAIKKAAEAEAAEAAAERPRMLKPSSPAPNRTRNLPPAKTRKKKSNPMGRTGKPVRPFLLSGLCRSPGIRRQIWAESCHIATLQ